jgi:hypothetical protein
MAAQAVAAVDDAASVRNAAGQWELSLADTNRKCRVTLRPDPAAGAYAIAMPAGCRRALPILADVLGWTAAADELKLTDLTGNVVLQFTGSSDPTNLTAKGPEGETYSLVPAAPGPRLVRTAPAVVAQATAAAPADQTAAAAPPVPNVDAIPGRYDILRAKGKDTNCQLTLDGKLKAPKGSKKATLAPACRDQGIVIFDPVGWRLDKGRLTLVARKGHETHLDLQSDGTWIKDPKEGAVLILKKI